MSHARIVAMTARKKILFAITKGNWGGAQRYVFDLATNIPKDRFDVVVLCGEGARLEEKLQERNIRVIRLPSLARDMNVWKDALSVYDFFKILKIEKPDIVHLNSSKIGGIGAFCSRLMGVKKIIFTGHGWAWNENRSLASKGAITFAHWVTILLTHTTIAVSQKVRAEILRLPFVSAEKVPLVYNGIASTDYLEHFAARAELDSKMNEKFWIGTIAELHKNKGLSTLIEAFGNITKSHPDVALVIVGEGEERQQLTESLTKLGLTKKVRLLGFVENAASFLKAFDVFVLPSKTEAFPYVLLEAGLAQLPVIASRVGGIPEVITDNKNGRLITPGDTEGLGLAIKELLEDSTKAAMFGHNLRKTVEDKFSTEQMIAATVDIYEHTPF